MNLSQADDRLIQVAPMGRVVTTELGNGLALLDLVSNEYFSLDEVGAFVWGILQTPRRKAEIVQAVVDQYEIAPEACSRDIDLLLRDLENAALVEERSGSSS
jgi:hypothetical protein